uniref:Uncharacterized protein n=1 Tax=Ciona savignyi TaxID=51511 RepID=H2YCK1_CIOSA
MELRNYFVNFRSDSPCNVHQQLYRHMLQPIITLPVLCVVLPYTSISPMVHPIFVSRQITFVWTNRNVLEHVSFNLLEFAGSPHLSYLPVTWLVGEQKHCVNCTQLRL